MMYRPGNEAGENNTLKVLKGAIHQVDHYQQEAQGLKVQRNWTICGFASKSQTNLVLKYSHSFSVIRTNYWTSN